MDRRALRIWRWAIVTSVAAGLLAAVAAGPAHAGSIWVADGNMSAGPGQSGSCDAFGLGGDLSIVSVPSSCPMSLQVDGDLPEWQVASWSTTAPPGITINSAFTTNGDVSSGGMADGFVAEDFWYTGGAWHGSMLAPGQQWFNTGLEGSSNINSQIYGFQIACTENILSGGCPPAAPTYPVLNVSGIELEATETSAPSVTGEGSLWGSGSYVWNPPGDSWPVTVYASDVSGICASGASLPSGEVNGPAEPRDTTVWQQCPDPASWSFPVDTRSQVPTDGSFQIGVSAVNAAGVVGYASKTVSVDNDPVTVSFHSPNDPNPGVWVNHAVTVDATPTAGPSGVGGMTCGTDGATAKSYPAAGLTVNGDGVHTVTCTAWNNAVDPQGQPNTGTSSMTVHIDESSPSIKFETQNPHDPTGLVIDTSDGESGVAGGTIEMAPAGTNDWTSLPTTFDGSHLLAHFDDAGLDGEYAFQATACDNVGNCAASTERLPLPLRLASDSQVSLTQIIDPLRRRTVIERVRRGGRLVTIKVVKFVRECSTRRVRTHGHGWKVERICRAPRVHATKTLNVPYGQPVTLHGLYTTAAGMPLPGERVEILAAPDNHSSAFGQITSVTTAANGSWSATLPPGPSRIIRAVTDGTATILPSSGQVTTIVPAKIRLVSVWPRRVPWGGTVHLVGQLLGGYLPPGGALVRLRIGYGSTYETYGVEEHVSGNGRFSTVASFGPGDPSILRTYWFQIASLPMGNYPYAPAASQRVPVIVGGHPR
jgi:hypothetical protein